MENGSEAALKKYNNNPKFIFKGGKNREGGCREEKKNRALVVSGNELNGSGEISAEDGLRRRHLLRKFNIKAWKYSFFKHYFLKNKSQRLNWNQPLRKPDHRRSFMCSEKLEISHPLSYQCWWLHCGFTVKNTGIKRLRGRHRCSAPFLTDLLLIDCQ